MAAPSYSRCVDTVRGKESDDISLLPVPVRLETFAKVNGSAADLSIGITAIRIWIKIDYWTDI